MVDMGGGTDAALFQKRGDIMEKKYPVLTRLDHDNRGYEPGSIVKLDEEIGEYLRGKKVLGHAIIEEPKEKTPPVMDPPETNPPQEPPPAETQDTDAVKEDKPKKNAGKKAGK